MNLAQLKQMLQNNLWYGENIRLRSADTPRISGALIQPDYTRVWGIDISGRWDGIVDLSVTKALGASFVFIKGVDGSIPTRYYKENYNKAREVGLSVAPYAWLYRNANVSCVAQARALHDLNQKYPPVLPSVIDFETTKYMGAVSNPDFSDLDKWVTEWLRLGNPNPLIYSGKYYMDQYGRMGETLKAKFIGLWLAAYGTNNPRNPFGWEWEYHQQSAEGDAQLIAPGSLDKKELDLDYYGTGANPEPPTGGSMRFFNIKAKVNIRSSTAVIDNPSNDIGDLLAGDKVEVSATIVTSDQWSPWGMIFRIIRADNTVVMLTNAYMTLNTSNIEETFPNPQPVGKPFSVTVELDGYKPATVTGMLEPL